MMFRAIDRIRVQLESADSGLKKYLAEELASLRRLGDRYMDHWMALDEQIGELFETFELSEVHKSDENPLTDTKSKPETLQTHVSRTGTHPYLAGSAYPTKRPTQLATTLSTPAQFSDEWDDMSSISTDAVTVALRKGMGYYDLLLYDEAAQSLSDVVENSDNVVAELYLAAAHVGRNRHEIAERHLESIRSQSKDPLVLCAAFEIEAQIHITNKHPQQAIHCFQSIIKMIPNYQDVWFNLGVCAAIAKDEEKAEAAFQKALQIDAEDPEALHLLAIVQMRRGNYEDATRTVNLALRRYPRHVDVLLLKSHLFQLNGELERRVQLCSEIARIHPDSKQAWVHLAWSYLDCGNQQAAIASFKKYLSAHPEDCEVLVQLGIVQFLSGNLNEAEKVLLFCLPRYDDKSYVWIALGRVSAQRGNPEQAYRRFLRALRDERREVKQLALYYYGLTLLDLERSTEAEKYLRAALVLGGKTRAILFALSETARKLGRGYEADKLLERAQGLAAAADSVHG